MNLFLRTLRRLGTSGMLVALLAISGGAATALAESGSGNSGSGSDNSGSGSDNRSPGNAEDRGQSGDNSNEDTSGDRGKSEDRRRDGTGTLPNPAPPKQGESLNVEPRGRVTIKLPGSSRPVVLTADASVPVGSVLDTRKGRVTLTTVPREDGTVQSATFSGAAFKVLQPKTGPAVTELRLRGGTFAGCGRPFAGRSMLSQVFTSKRRGRKARSLWGRGKGRFRTRGRHGAATVRGTIWQTKDTCAGTRVFVRRGVVDVRDYAKSKTVAVRAGHSYLARRANRR